ncbi:MAG: phage holin family protein [Bacteroidales bacterium]
MEENEKHHEQIFRDVKNYADLRMDLLKLDIVEKVSRILSVFLVSILALLLLIAGMFYATMAFVYWSESAFGSLVPGFGIVTLFFLILAGCIYLLRNKLFINPFVRIFSKIFFEPNEITNDDKKTGKA